MPTGLETVFLKGMDSDIWINPGSTSSIQEIVSVDDRFKTLPPVINGEIYNNIKRLNDRGGNDYWESGILSPHIILKDLASIFHPDLFRDYNAFYYEKIY